MSNETKNLTTQEKRSDLTLGNKALREKKYDIANELYKKAAQENHDLTKIIEFNIAFAKKRMKASLPVNQAKKNSNLPKKIDSPIGQGKSDHPMEIIKQSGLFDAEFYLYTNPDVAAAGVDPLRHFHMHGWKEKRQPSPNFDIEFYIETYPESTAEGLNPLVYHIKFGINKGNKTIPRETPKRNTNKKIEFIDDPAVGPKLPYPWLDESPLLKALASYAEPHIEKLPKSIRAIAEASIVKNPLKISVIVPMWNRESSIQKAVLSALSQSYKPFEILIIDDGSTDQSCTIVKREFGNEINSGLVKLIEISHEGVSAARNAGLKASSGDLIAYLDSDNIWRPDYLLVMCSVFAEIDEIFTAYSALQHNDLDSQKRKVIGETYDRHRLLHSNYIDLNVFMHRRIVYTQAGGFDTNLRRLVDWDYILRCTEMYPPAYIQYVGVDYFLEKSLGNITRTVPLEENRNRIYSKHINERIRYGISPLRIAYVLWDWPALSQTFVVEEIRWLIEHGQDIIVYYKVAPDRAANINFDIEVHQVSDADHLGELLKTHNRNICHAHFAYPATTLLAYPACKATNTPFTFFAHAVDIFHENNKKRNLVDTIVKDPLCLKVFVHGEYHRATLEAQGVPTNKIFYNFQAINLSAFAKVPKLRSAAQKTLQRGVFIGRFVEKKGVHTLIEAAALLKNDNVTFDLYGYGSLDGDYRVKIEELGIQNINLLGPLEGSDVVKAIENADFLIVPSVVAKNGDTEGFPTVIFESMAAGRPVVTTTVSAIPDYLSDMDQAIVVEPNNPKSLADGIRRLVNMPESRRAALIQSAKHFLESYVSTKRTMEAYFDVWRKNLIDIFLVTYNTEKYENRAETFEIISRILLHTNSPFTLTIIDNASDKSFRDELTEIAKRHSNVRLVLKRENVLCGPASNIAMSLGNGNYVIYLCSKEAFIGKHGWDRTLIRHMRTHKSQALAGYRTHLPKFTLGKELTQHSDFPKFRNQQFAITHSDRPFTHVQGGAFILRKSVIKDFGGFSSKLPQGNMDVEFSYFLESCGLELGSIPGVVSITTKTLPRITSVIDEHTVISHPLTIDSAQALLDRQPNSNEGRCNICGHSILKGINYAICPKCNSTPLGRTVFRRLAHDWRAHRNGLALLLTSDTSLPKAIGERMFRVVYSGIDIDKLLAAAELKGKEFKLIVIDPALLRNDQSNNMQHELDSIIQKFLKHNGILLHPQILPNEIDQSSWRNSTLLELDWRPLRERRNETVK